MKNTFNVKHSETNFRLKKKQFAQLLLESVEYKAWKLID